MQFNPQPQIAVANAEAARARAQSARAALGPTLQIVPGIGGTMQSRDEEIILSQPIDLFGARRANRAVFDAQLRGAQSQVEGARRALIISVKSAAAELFIAQEARSLGQSQLEIARAFRDAAARRAQLGAVPAVQVQRAQLELDRAAIELDAARARNAIRRVRLNQLIGAPPNAPLVVAMPVSLLNPFSLGQIELNLAENQLNLDGIKPNPGETKSDFAKNQLNLGGVVVTSPQIAPASLQIEAASPQIAPDLPQIAPDLRQIAPASPQIEAASPQIAPDLRQIEAASPQIATNSGDIVPASSQIEANMVTARAALLPGALQRPDILSAQAAVEVARAQANAIGAQRRPQFAIQARRGGVIYGSSTSLRAVFTIPLFGSGQNRNAQRAAQFEAQAGEKQLDLLRSQVAAQLESALISLDQNRAVAARYRESLVPLALDLLRKTQIGYDEGASTYLEVLEAQRATKQIQTEYLQALAGVRAGEAELESALGAPYLAPAGTLANPDSLQAPPGVAAPGTVPNIVASE